MNIRENSMFGLSRDTALLYSLDNYSTPDNWHGLGYELQYELVVFFNKIIREAERMEFLLTLAAIFSHSFSVPQNHIAMDYFLDDKLSDLLENAFGVPLNEGDKMQPPFDMLRGIQFSVLWERGRLDLGGDLCRYESCTLLARGRSRRHCGPLRQTHSHDCTR